MSIITIAWSMCAAASGMLGLMQVFLWFRERRSPAYLLTGLACFSAAASAMIELALMHAASTVAYAELVRWQNLAVFLLIIPLVWAVYLHLGTGRRWLALTISALWCITIAINFGSSASITFLEIEKLKTVSTFWGETFIGAVAVRNPWVTVPDLASLLSLFFFADAAVRSWRHGRRRGALTVGIGAASFVLIGGVHTPLVDAGIVQAPYMVSFAFLTMVFAMSYELVAAAVQASRNAREIEASNKRWNALMSNVHLSVVGIGADRRVNYVNPFFERLSGYSLAELVGVPATRLVVEGDRVELERRLQIAEEAGPRPQSKWTILCRSGERRQVLFSSVRQESPDGRYEGVLTIGKDITEQLRAERELTVARREMERLMRANMLGELASALAHELNQPLAAILSNAQAARRLLGSNALGPEELGEILDDVVRDDRRASEVIARMRSMVGKGEVKLQRIQVNTAVRAVVDILRGELDAQNVRLNLRWGENLPPVLAGEIEVQQVLMNLMMNALRAVEKQPEKRRRIDIETEQRGGQVRVSVRDWGSGISQQVAERMFEPFFTTKAVGIGMGLAICRRIVDAHAGKIWKQDVEREGTSIAFELPVSQDPSETQSA